MQTSRFQLGLVATLAAGLGFSLSSADAVGYPAGPAVSMGSNPVVSVAGLLSGADSASPLTAPGGTNLIINGIVLSAFDHYSACTGNTSVVLSVNSSEVGRFVVGLSRPGDASYTAYEQVVSINLPAGIRVPAGQTLNVQSVPRYFANCESNAVKIEYTLSGYYAE